MRKSKKNNRRKRAKYSLRAQSANRQTRRRGILLLVVLSLLVLFLLVGTAFITSSDDYRKASKTLAAPYEPAVNPLQHRDLLDETLGQLVRDTNNPHSSLRYHSLLRDLYGSDGLLIGPNSPHRLQFVDRSAFTFTFANSGNVFDPNDIANRTGNQFFSAIVRFDPNDGFLSLQEDYYNGRLFTLVNGPAAGRSARVVRYFVNNSIRQALFYLMFADSDRNFSTNELAIQPNTSAVLNGQPFNGTGVGYNFSPGVNAPQLNALEEVPDTAGGLTNREVALMPNSVYFDPNSIAFPRNPINYILQAGERNLPLATRNFLTSNRGLTGLGGSDESYDAVDFQNMALAWSPVNPIETVAYSSDSLDNMVIPSFHRPALINYWKANGSLRNEPGLLRKVLMRPSWYDHQQFDGSNPEFAARLQDFVDNPTNARAQNTLVNQMIYGPWDVDNDNDSRRDSVWVDVGLPVMMSPQGRLVKPLAAILCVDLDGRLNLNAHGTRELAGPNSNPLDGNPTAQTMANGVSSANLPSGQGYGPAEIDLWPVLQGPLNTSIFNASTGNPENLYTRVLHGVTTTNLDERRDPFTRPWSGRYGQSGIDILPGRGAPTRGPASSYDLLAQLKQQGLPRRVAATSNDPNHYLGNYATPPDLMGRYALGLNDLGQPVYEVIADPVDLDIDSPYELNLSRLGPSAAGMNSQDGPFTVGELERILRAYDEDASKLPQRLWELANNFIPTNTTSIDPAEIEEWRGLLTTDSFDLPVPNVTLPEWMQSGPDGDRTTTNDNFLTVMGREVNLTFSDLLEYRVRLALAQALSVTPVNVDPNDVQPIMRQLLAQELADGTRLDLNRPFGNGRDDNNNGVVDEPGEADPGNSVERPYWDLDIGRLDTQSAAANTSDFTGNNGRFRDDVDRDGDGDIEFWERGDNDRSGRLRPEELIELHNYRRQLYARHLYVLASTLVDPVPSNATKKQREKRAERLAQWAINVADYRDPDNIMTGFEYDEKPFDGWGRDPNNVLDGALDTIDDPNNRGVVWGAERPELLITETLAWHDRRTRDSRLEGEVDLRETPEEQQPPGTPQKGTVPVRAPSPGSGPFDKSFDQQQRPQGAAFIELYNPWPAETAANADTHAVDSSGRDLGIDLARTHDDNLLTPDPNTGDPLWRIVIYRNGGIDKKPESQDEDYLPTNVSGENIADRTIYFTGRDPGSGTRPMGWDDTDGVAFYNDLEIANTPETYAVPSVRPGSYLVVAGVDTDATTGQELTPNSGEFFIPFGENDSQSTQRGIFLKTNVDPNTNPNTTTIEVRDSSGVAMMDSNGTGSNPADDFRVQAFAGQTSVAIIDRALPNTDYPYNTRRFTFTEPANGYPRSVSVESNKGFSNSAFDPARGKSGEYVPFLDIPLDDVFSRALPGAGGGLAGGRRGKTALTDGETRLALPLDDKGPRTVPNFNWVYLQRLSNPLLPWNPEPKLPNGTDNLRHDPSKQVNPYLTIDSMGVNVTVFNGLSTDRRERWILGDKLINVSNNNATQTFASNQRGRANDPTKLVSDDRVNTAMAELVRRGRRSLLDIRSRTRDFIFDPNASETGADRNPKTSPFRNNIWTSDPTDFFTLNRSGPDARGHEGTTGHAFEALPDTTLGFLNEPFRAKGSAPTQGAVQYTPTDPNNPSQPLPLPWFAWQNRPYVNAAELLQVPKFSMVDLPRAFAFLPLTTLNEAYQGDPVVVQDSQGENFVIDGVFPHLMNFFRDADPNNTVTTAAETIVGLHRVLEYVGVPSRYVGTEKWLSPASFGDPVVSSDDPRYLRQPPFNRISNYRDPGRVNLNTIGAAGRGAVWHAMFHGSSKYDGDPNHPERHVAIDDDGFFSVRRGYGEFGDDVALLNSNSPTLVANPFRAPDTGDLVPSLVPPQTTFTLVRENIETTLLRSMGMPNNNIPSFNNNSTVPVVQPVGVPLLSAGETEPHINSFRNSAFRYDPLKRLSSFGTTHSNVYAVWITIGFFEVEPAPPIQDYSNGDPGFASINNLNPTAIATKDLYDRVYPEGYQYGRETEADAGQPQRLRMFAIVDRSVPVAFEPGSDHNVERAIRLKRRIE